MTTDKIEALIATRSAALADRMAFELDTLKLSDIAGPDSPHWLHSQLTGSAADLVAKLIDSRLTLADESFARAMMEELAVQLAQTGNGAGLPVPSSIAAADIRAYSHRGGQSFWHMLSGNVGFYPGMIAQLGRRAKERRQALSPETNRACNRLTREFIRAYCTPACEINWRKIATTVANDAA
jgi:hypothetical protein